MAKLQEPVYFRITPKALLDKALRVYWEKELEGSEDKEKVLSKTLDKLLKKSILWWDDEVGIIGIRQWQRVSEIPGEWEFKEEVVGEWITFYITPTKRKWYLKSFISLEEAQEEVARVKRNMGIEPVLLRISQDFITKVI